MMINETKSSMEECCSRHASKPRYGRLRTVEQLYGIKRGSCYNLLREGKIRGCALRLTSKRSRTRIIDLESVEAYIEQQMQEQNDAGQAKDLKSVD